MCWILTNFNLLGPCPLSYGVPLRAFRTDIHHSLYPVNSGSILLTTNIISMNCGLGKTRTFNLQCIRLTRSTNCATRPYTSNLTNLHYSTKACGYLFTTKKPPRLGLDPDCWCITMNSNYPGFVKGCSLITAWKTFPLTFSGGPTGNRTRSRGLRVR